MARRAALTAAPPDEGAEAAGIAGTPAERALERDIGQQVRSIRRKQELSVSDLASAAGISNGMLSKIENGGISPSLSTLQAISTALQVPLSSLFATFEERQDCSYVPAGQALKIDRRGSRAGHIYHLLGHMPRGDVAVEPYLVTLAEGAEPHTGYRHGGMEFIHLLEGRLRYRHGSKSYDLEPGDSLLFDSGALHGPEKLNDPATRYLSIIVYSRGS